MSSKRSITSWLLGANCVIMSLLLAAAIVGLVMYPQVLANLRQVRGTSEHPPAHTPMPVADSTHADARPDGAAPDDAAEQAANDPAHLQQPAAEVALTNAAPEPGLDDANATMPPVGDTAVKSTANAGNDWVPLQPRPSSAAAGNDWPQPATDAAMAKADGPHWTDARAAALAEFDAARRARAANTNAADTTTTNAPGSAHNPAAARDKPAQMPNYRKLRTELLDVADALVRLNHQLANQGKDKKRTPTSAEDNSGHSHAEPANSTVNPQPFPADDGGSSPTAQGPSMRQPMSVQEPPR